MRHFRKERVAALIQELVSELMARKLNDPRIAPLTTVSRVEVIPDLSVANVFVIVRGDPKVERETLFALRHAAGFVRRAVAKELTMRTCPEIRFQIDEVAKKVQQMMQILNENRLERESKEAAAGIAPEAGAAVDAGEGGEEE